MDALGLAVVAVVAIAGVLAVLTYGPRPAPGDALPPLHRPPIGSNTHVHRDGLPWCDWEVPVPPRRHQCWPHSGGWKNTPAGWAWYERCPCGGERTDEGPWLSRNCHRSRYGDASIYVQPEAALLGGGTPEGFLGVRCMDCAVAEVEAVIEGAAT